MLAAKEILTDYCWRSWAEQQGVPLAPTTSQPEMVWIDYETTGLDSLNDVILEMGIVLTDRWGRLVADSAARWLVFDYSDPWWMNCVDRMNPYVREMHEKSGLLNDLAAVTKAGMWEQTNMQVQAEAIEFLGVRFGRTFEGADRLPACGNSIHFDRSFMKLWMPALDNWFLHRNGDVSSLRYFAKLHAPDVMAREPQKREFHRPIPDLIDSIKLYRHLMTNLLIEEA